MIAYISGKLSYKSPASVIIDSNGLGYQLSISLNTWSKIESSESCRLYTYLHVKSENQSVSAFELYGFADTDEKELFEKLVSVSGIGANTARMMLSSLAPDEVRSAVLAEDVDTIKSVKGIGPKTAKRLILELKDKITMSGGDQVIPIPKHNTANQEALSALISLGFNKPVAEKALKAALRENGANSSVESLIKESLKKL